MKSDINTFTSWNYEAEHGVLVRDFRFNCDSHSEVCNFELDIFFSEGERGRDVKLKFSDVMSVKIQQDAGGLPQVSSLAVERDESGLECARFRVRCDEGGCIEMLSKDFWIEPPDNQG